MTLDGHLRAVVERIRIIADDCFDLRAIERLRNLADEIDRVAGAPPIILSRDGDSGHRADDS